ncbi:hypothetical protein JT180_07190 [Helicobacter pylori]|nr:hypothetical protein [Helicobacter pylori]
MKTIEWNEEQRKAFQGLLRKFKELIDDKVQEGKQTGKPPTIPKYVPCQRELNKFLALWGYACKISPGSGNLSYEPSITFCRQDILGEGFVNGEKPTPTKGFYFFLLTIGASTGASECENVKKFDLCIGRSTKQDGEEELQKCPAYDKIIDPNRDPHYQEIYDDLESDLESITDYFLHLVNEFNQIPTAHFELEPSSASH